MACQISSHGVARSTWCIWYRSMWSVLSLRRLASQARRRWYADKPRPLGPGPIGWYTFVANTTSSRRPLRCSHRPTTSSAMPYP